MKYPLVVWVPNSGIYFLDPPGGLGYDLLLSSGNPGFWSPEEPQRLSLTGHDTRYTQSPKAPISPYFSTPQAVIIEP